MTKRAFWLLLLGALTAGLAVAPGLWAAPGQDPNRQTVPTRTSSSPPTSTATSRPTSASTSPPTSPPTALPSVSSPTSSPTFLPPTSTQAAPAETVEPADSPIPVENTQVAVPVSSSPATSESDLAEASPVPESVSICVLAYHDRDRDTYRNEETEELLPTAKFILSDESGVVSQYVSDGVSEPFCFTDLAPGAYRVIHSAPPGYEPSGSVEWVVALVGGTSFEHQFGDMRSEGAAPDETIGSSPGPEGEGERTGQQAFGRFLSTVAKVSGVLALVLAVGIAVLFVLDRREL